ncbi:Golgi transport complex subunit 1 [Apophysomyces sp. BC1034]|nr:Golgi transport complex subunit 1 [Apophysomyces sp. BC1015]KAG0193234.1 Golgi transport complex subunit 1 [Apophysomyces sp. BC1034]
MSRKGTAPTVEQHVPRDDDPDSVLAQASVAEVRALEKRTRADIETQKKELRAMVGEQYLDLISAADAIIAMSRNAQEMRQKLETMQNACDVSAIQKKATMQSNITSSTEETKGDRKQRQLYLLAALIKALADIWHALENHHYLHAGRLYKLAKVVKEQLEVESSASFIDMDVAFPVVQRQWDAVSFFMPQIVQKSVFHLRVAEQDAEDVAEILTVLMLSDEKTFEGALRKLLETRLSAIRDIVTASVNGAQIKLQDQRVAHQLREIVQVIKRTFVHVYQIFIPKENSSLLETYVTELCRNFMMPTNSHHGHQPAITRVFLPSTNVHLLVRYLPESVQRYTPEINTGKRLTQANVQSEIKEWISQIHQLMENNLSLMLRHVCSGLLNVHYSLWDAMLRDSFNGCAKRIIDSRCDMLAEQPRKVVWKRITDDPQAVSISQLSSMIWPSPHSQVTPFQLPNLSSSVEIAAFKQALGEAAQGQTNCIRDLQVIFESALNEMRIDMEFHFAFNEMDQFHAKIDTTMLNTYFQDRCLLTISKYVTGLRELLQDLASWPDQKLANDLAIFVGRLARVIAVLSKELPRVLMATSSYISTLDLRSGIDKDPKYAQLQKDMVDTFWKSHDGWIELIATEFTQKLRTVLAQTKWNDQCAAILIWEAANDNGEEMHLPTQPTNAIVRIIFDICDEMRRVTSNMLDQASDQSLRQRVWQATAKTLLEFLGGDKINMTEKGAIQLVFDIYFMASILQSRGDSIVIGQLKSQIDPINWATFEPHLGPSVERFYLKHTLIFGVLTRAGGESFER